jgi:hypothetical protein
MASVIPNAWDVRDPVELLQDRDAARLPRAELEAIQLAGLRGRFEQLRQRVAVLTVLADEQAITTIRTLDDAAPLLFQHTMYKSYPVGLLLRHRFADLTRWLQRLTTVDLSGVPVDGIAGIDGWIDALDAHTSLRVITSSGTTGTMSLLPRSTAELASGGWLEGLVAGGGPREVVWPNFRSGATAFGRLAELLERRVAGRPERFHALHPGRVSADLLLLAARRRAAQARGERLDVDGSLLAASTTWKAGPRPRSPAAAPPRCTRWARARCTSPPATRPSSPRSRSCAPRSPAATPSSKARPTTP